MLNAKLPTLKDKHALMAAEAQIAAEKVQLEAEEIAVKSAKKRAIKKAK